MLTIISDIVNNYILRMLKRYFFFRLACFIEIRSGKQIDVMETWNLELFDVIILFYQAQFFF